MLQNFNNAIGVKTSVNNYPEGASPYGVLGMSGNVRQWVADWYQEDYYHVAPDLNPRGPDSGLERVLKGGSFSDTAQNLRSANRFFHDPNSAGLNRGFRCAATSL